MDERSVRYPYNIPMRIRKNNPEWREQLAWMISTFGRRTGTDQDRWRADGHRYWFKHKEDAFIFALRWS